MWTDFYFCVHEEDYCRDSCLLGFIHSLKFVKISSYVLNYFLFSLVKTSHHLLSQQSIRFQNTESAFQSQHRQAVLVLQVQQIVLRAAAVQLVQVVQAAQVVQVIAGRVDEGLHLTLLEVSLLVIMIWLRNGLRCHCIWLMNRSNKCNNYKFKYNCSSNNSSSIPSRPISKMR